MTRTDAGIDVTSFGKIGIIAGNGLLPISVAHSLASQGRPFAVLGITGEMDPRGPLSQYQHEFIALEEFGSLARRLKAMEVETVVLAGGVERRPKLSQIRPNWETLRVVPTIIRGLSLGDDGLLRVIVRYLEKRGLKVAGAHEIVPDLLTPKGPLGHIKPSARDLEAIRKALEAAKAIGALDIGQGAVAVGRRVIALEGIEGTDGLLERVAAMRGHGRLAGKEGGVLVKCAKPEQELRADLPTIGPNTLRMAHAAGLNGVCVEAERSLLLEAAEAVCEADRLGLYLYGVTAEEQKP
ncbi:LpxI family protein [Limoniibacter endophyticus]|uniref:UDP-2,3-diacylglucosamine pyrophosphatase LpxI n=1 Tax=Limoniibacter endophyticus TaxID=1565040 RepID=A0A8J3GGT2_9HYPH|nr:UDP-2,3-diacylglucosamine diphosphatase LpxI [Limoniibacter endophyticus]GHC62042.1 hypothetical protein GCM10010136_03000 [Limoniibacter endophyticus]